MGIPGTGAGGRRKVRRKKPDELLSSVVRETAIPASVELLRANTRFVFPSGTAWVMLVLAAEDIGGLSRRHGRDEAKGSIIELIGSDQIKTLATAEMLAAEVCGIIPDADTLARMEEFSLLTGAEYSWAVVWQKPNGDLLVDLIGEVTFAQAQAVASGFTSLQDAVGPEAWQEHSGVAEDPGTSPAEVSASGSDAADDDEGDEIFDPIPDDDEDGDALADDVDDEPVFADGVDDVAEGVAAPVHPEPDFGEVDGPGVPEPAEDDDEGEDDPAAHQPDAVQLADQDEARAVIARRFLSEDLDLDVRLDEFNATFGIGAAVVQIEVPEGATEWLGDQVAQLNRQANASLAQLRRANEDALRALFVNLVSTHVEQVVRDVATDRDGSRYKALKEAAEQAHAQRRSDRDQTIGQTKAAIVRAYEEQAKRLAAQAAIQAEIAYKERNRSRMEREQADAAAAVDRALEDGHSHDLQEILRVRRSDAALKMQVGVTRIFELLAERQTDYLRAEEERLREWETQIQRIADDNRKADIARADALAEHHRTTDEVGLLRREQDALLESVRDQHADRLRRLQEELDRNREEAAARLRASDTEWQHSLDVESARTDSQTARVADLLLQVETVEQSVERRFDERLAGMKADNESLTNGLARVSEIQKRSNTILVVLIVALALLMAAAGFIAGAGYSGLGG